MGNMWKINGESACIEGGRDILSGIAAKNEVHTINWMQDKCYRKLYNYMRCFILLKHNLNAIFGMRPADNMKREPKN